MIENNPKINHEDFFDKVVEKLCLNKFQKMFWDKQQSNFPKILFFSDIKKNWCKGLLGTCMQHYPLYPSKRFF